ncbi:MAG: enoyl-CoA hydratase, partial [Alphaproteobacteria bacterium HGW-Alphaproteobacteria-9]
MSLIQINREGAVTTLTLNRAETMNPLGAPGDGDAFVAVVNAINRDMECRVVILTGAGRAFSAGG